MENDIQDFSNVAREISVEDELTNMSVASNPSINYTGDLDKVKDRIMNRISEARNFYEEHFKDNHDLFYAQYKMEKPGKTEDDWHSDQVLPITVGIINTKKPQLKKQIIAEQNFFGVSSDKENQVDETTGEVLIDYTKSARLHETVIRKQLDKMNFYRTFDDFLLDMFIFKYTCMRLSWQFEQGTREYFDIKEGQVVPIQEQTILCDSPMARSIAPADLMIDPKAVCVDKARYIAERVERTVESIRNNPQVYSLPDVAEFLMYCEDNEIETAVFYDYYEGNGYGCRRLATITEDGKYLLCNHANPYKHGKFPFFVHSEYMLQRSVYGMSTAEIVSDIQTFESDLTNLEADQAMLSSITPLIYNEDAAIDGRNFTMRPGKNIVLPQGYAGKFEGFKLPSSGLDGDKMFARFQGILNQSVGNLQYMNETQFAGVNKTATGASLIDENLKTQSSDKATDIREDVLKPFLYMMLELNQQYLTVEEAINLIGERKAKELIIEPKAIDWNAKYDFKITGEDGRTTNNEKLKKQLAFMEVMKSVPEVKAFIKARDFSKEMVLRFGLDENLIIEEPKEEVKPEIEQGGNVSEEKQFNSIVEQLSKMTGKSPETITEELANGKTPADYEAEMTQGGQGIV